MLVVAAVAHTDQAIQVIMDEVGHMDQVRWQPHLAGELAAHPESTVEQVEQIPEVAEVAATMVALTFLDPVAQELL
jgi:hypothetical protein